MATKFKVADHTLVPKHEKLSDKARAELLAKYNISDNDLPRISIKDPAIQSLNVKIGDVVMVTRSSLTAGTSLFYRRVS